MKILTVVGARPQFIKAATISRVIQSMQHVEEVIVHTGQHFDKNMSTVFFEEMHIPRPNYNLDISSLSHGAMTGRMIEGIEQIIMSEQPDWVLVYGDTNSTLAGALAASKLHVRVTHVEAGLRSFNMAMPEEQNRILTDRLSTLLCCPTDTALLNLAGEGYDKIPVKIAKVGDVMFDAAQYYSRSAKIPSWLDKLDLASGFVLATIHRAENTGDPKRLADIVHALNKVHSDLPVVLPLHPRTRRVARDLGIKFAVNIVEPIGYLEMVSLLQSCKFVLSDSGGVQKEAYFFGKSCLVLREETEWTELVDSGHNVLVGSDKLKIADAIKNIEYGKDFSHQFYGDGAAAELIVNEMLNFDCGPL